MEGGVVEILKDRRAFGGGRLQKEVAVERDIQRRLRRIQTIQKDPDAIMERGPPLLQQLIGSTLLLRDAVDPNDVGHTAPHSSGFAALSATRILTRKVQTGKWSD